jgi:hypothetical protein
VNRAERRAAKPHPNATPQDRVTIGYIAPGDVSMIFMDSVDRMKRYELARTGMWLGMISRKAGSGWIAGARNFVTAEFMRSESDWLLFIDADMGFPEWAVHRMVGVARGGESFKPIIGGLCFSLSTTDWDPETNGETFECFPTIGIWNRNEDGDILGYKYVLEYEKDSVLHVDSSGAAMLLIHRSALEKIGPDGWWTPLEIPDGSPGLEGRAYFSEDISFFIRASQADLPVWIDTMTKTSHDKHGIHVTEKTWDFQQAIKAAAGVEG